MMSEVSTVWGAENGVRLNFRKRVLWVIIDVVTDTSYRVLRGNHSINEKGNQYSKFGIKLERLMNAKFYLQEITHEEVLAVK